MNKYQVKIEDSILPEVYTLDQLLEAGLLDDIDDKIKVKLVGDSAWITAREYPFSDLEKENPATPVSVSPVRPTVAPRIQRPRTTTNNVHTNQVPNNHVRVNVNTQVYSQTSPIGQNQSAPEILNSWNWGAFSLSWIWGICNGIYWPLVIIVLNFIPYVGVVLSLATCLYLGLKGNQLAWNCSSDRNVASFERKQSTWNLAGQVIFILALLSGLVLGVISVLL